MQETYIERWGHATPRAYFFPVPVAPAAVAKVEGWRSGNNGIRVDAVMSQDLQV